MLGGYGLDINDPTRGERRYKVLKGRELHESREKVIWDYLRSLLFIEHKSKEIEL